jgi:hypothetical protein
VPSTVLQRIGDAKGFGAIRGMCARVQGDQNANGFDKRSDRGRTTVAGNEEVHGRQRARELNECIDKDAGRGDI